MMERLFILLGLVLWIVVFISPDVHAQVKCPTRWFGSDCQYKCHCTNNCDTNGDCAAGDTCEKGWFGPQCQYVDLTYTQNDNTTKQVFIDADDGTCNKDTSQRTGTLNLRRKFPITWLRLHFSIEGVLEFITVTFKNNGVTYQCINKRSTEVDRRTIDIYCDVGAEVDRVTYTGRAVGYLCSIYISGGRNIALKQSQVNQSSTFYEYTSYSLEASNAVDGNTDQDFHSGSCTHTSGNEPNPYWSVQFTQSKDVNRYVIYNRLDSNMDRLKGFVLTSFDQDGDQVFQHTDSLPTPQSVYEISAARNTSSIKSVNIIATDTQNEHILTLCEVEVYGGK